MSSTICSRIARLLIACTLLASFGVPSVRSQSDGFPIGSSALACEQQPTGFPFTGGGCFPVSGAIITFTLLDGSWIADCVTEGHDVVATCNVVLPFGVTVLASIDISVFPVGYVLVSPNPQQIDIPSGPPQGVFGGPVFMAIRSEPVAEPTPGPISTAIEVEVSQEDENPAVRGRPAGIYAGSCSDLSPRPAFALNDVPRSTGEVSGNPDAHPGTSSQTIIDIPLADLLAHNHAIAVHLSHQALQDSGLASIIACGEVGGVSMADGSLVIGLRDYSRYHFSGIAVLSINPANTGDTVVTLYLSRHLSGQ